LDRIGYQFVQFQIWWPNLWRFPIDHEFWSLDQAGGQFGI
jgi:hypothetical protein